MRTDILHPKQKDEALPVHRFNTDTQTMEFWDAIAACWKPDHVCGMKSRIIRSRYPVAAYIDTFAEPVI